MADDVSIKSVIIGFIIFSFFITGFVAIMSSSAQEPDSGLNNTEYLANSLSLSGLSKETELNSLLNTARTNVTTETTWYDGISNWVTDSIFGRIWASVKVMTNSVSVMGDTWDNVADIIGIPQWVVGFATLLLTVVIIFGLIYMGTGTKP